MTVKRYNAGCAYAGEEEMVQVDDGAYVSHEDYAALLKERDALRESGLNGQANTRAAADIYFQLIEECDIQPGGSLVEHIDGMRDRIAELESAPSGMMQLSNELAEMKRKCAELTVWYGPMPESNGKTNWTAILHRKGESLSAGITIDRSEYPDRVRYEADRMRYLIGELDEKPWITNYDANKHSGYTARKETK